MNDKRSDLKPCPLAHYVSAGLRVNKTDPRILCLDCGLTLAATDWTTLYERWDSRVGNGRSVKALLRYVDHLRGCSSYTNGACTCGLESATRELATVKPDDNT